MSRRIPMGPENLYCPFWQKPMCEVCHKCPLWTQVRGTDPNTGEEVDDWNCSLGWLPMMLIENAQQSRQTGAAVESFRNESVARDDRNFKAAEESVEAIKSFRDEMVKRNDLQLRIMAETAKPLLEGEKNG